MIGRNFRRCSRMPTRTVCFVVCCAILSIPLASAQQHTPVQAPTDVKAMSTTLEDVQYPHAVRYMPLTLYGQDVRMAYMDVPPANQPNGHAVVLLHGMNFYGEYWSGPIEVLRKERFRVIVPDQVGFGRSTKAVIPYNFSDMAAN